MGLWFYGLTSLCSAQNGIRAFGVQFKPIFPLAVVNTEEKSVVDNSSDTRLNINQKSGYSVGAVIRIGLAKRFSMETGIHVINRYYDFKMTGKDVPATDASLSLRSFEIPAIGMVFVRLGEQLYMNAAGGITFDLFPTGGIVTYKRDSIEFGILESNWLIPALSANIGVEYRTKKNGYFYFGSSYHQPFKDMATVYVSYRKTNTSNFVTLVNPPPQVKGNYFTIDIRYYFNPGMKGKKEN
jgi:hypothetical protein